MILRNVVKKMLGRFGYEIYRREEPIEVERVRQVCEAVKIPILQPLATNDYQRACPPLLPDPSRVPSQIGLRHYHSLAEAVENVSMRNYFEVKNTDDGFTITDNYPESHYHSRQRMLYTAYAKCFGPRLDGLSVLDVGCSSGYYSFFCSRLGAAPVVGIDARPEHEDQFDLLHQMLGMPDTCRYRHVDMETELETMKESYDLVLAQGVLYHVYDHPRFLKNMFRLTRRVLVLEGECSGRSDNLCIAKMEETANLRSSVHGPVIYPSLSWMVELLRWVGFRGITYVQLPLEVEDTWRFADLYRAMLVAVK